MLYIVLASHIYNKAQPNQLLCALRSCNMIKSPHEIVISISHEDVMENEYSCLINELSTIKNITIYETCQQKQVDHWKHIFKTHLFIIGNNKITFLDDDDVFIPHVMDKYYVSDKNYIGTIAMPKTTESFEYIVDCIDPIKYVQYYNLNKSQFRLYNRWLAGSLFNMDFFSHHIIPYIMELESIYTADCDICKKIMSFNTEDNDYDFILLLNEPTYVYRMRAYIASYIVDIARKHASKYVEACIESPEHVSMVLYTLLKSNSGYFVDDEVVNGVVKDIITATATIGPNIEHCKLPDNVLLNYDYLHQKYIIDENWRFRTSIDECTMGYLEFEDFIKDEEIMKVLKHIKYNITKDTYVQIIYQSTGKEATYYHRDYIDASHYNKSIYSISFGKQSKKFRFKTKVFEQGYYEVEVHDREYIIMHNSSEYLHSTTTNNSPYGRIVLVVLEH